MWPPWNVPVFASGWLDAKTQKYLMNPIFSSSVSGSQASCSRTVSPFLASPFPSCSIDLVNRGRRPMHRPGHPSCRHGPSSIFCIACSIRWSGAGWKPPLLPCLLQQLEDKCWGGCGVSGKGKPCINLACHHSEMMKFQNNQMLLGSRFKV